MSFGVLVFFLFLDFGLLIVFFLLFSYYGLIFPMLFLFALIMFLLLIFDSRRDVLSDIMIEAMNLQEPPEDKKEKAVNRRKKHSILPFILAIFIMLFSLFQLFRHGFISPVQAFSDSGVFAEFAFWLSGFGFIIFLYAVRYYNSLKNGGQKKKE